MVSQSVREVNVPPRKRPRTESVAQTTKQPRLFAPFRALGLVTNHVPFVFQTRSYKGATDGPRMHLVTCLGKAWAMWEGGKMGLLFVGSDLEEAIAHMAIEGDAVWVASGSHVIEYLRGKEERRLSNPFDTNLSFILLFAGHLLALTEDGSTMLAWDTASGDLSGSMRLEPNFTATTILHPATYLNKVLVGSSQGGLQLWNIRTWTKIHEFSPSSLLISSSKISSGPNCAVTALVQSPAIDVIGLGFSSGEILVYDVRADERLMKMSMQEGVRALSFRSDGQPILASASSSGHLALWDLNSGGRLLHLVRGAHDGAITALEWVPGQPVLITSGEDNSVKQWVFDSPTAAPRLLKYRSGHHAPPHLIRYYGEDGKQLLTASRDRSLRCTSVVRDSRSFEFSQGSLSKKASHLSISIDSLKFPTITSLSYSTTRAKDWVDILTAHADETFSRTWSMKDKKVGNYTFGFTPEKKGGSLGSVKAVCVSACGNFGLTASSTGIIHMYNIQSGILRKTFSLGPCPSTVSSQFRPSGSSKKSQTERCVIGLATDALNTVVIASTLDGTVNFFDFHTAKLEHTLVLPSATVSITLHRENGLLAVICDDLIVRIIDIETRKIVRELGGFRGRVLDLTFSPDSRWLVATSLDSVIRTFDIPTGRLIDAFRTPSVATSLSFSPTNDFLATAHIDSVGVFLWMNRAQYSDVALQSVTEVDETVDISLPSMQGVAEDEALEALADLNINSQQEAPSVFASPPQLDGDLVTLTLLPRARWQTLLNLEIIQQRNKPKEPPKEHEKAPFFLPTLPGVEPRFAIEDKPVSKKSTKRLQKVAASAGSAFYTTLVAEDSDGDYDKFFDYAKALSPAAMDVELRSLVTLEAIRLFLHCLTRRLLSHRDFEAVQTYLNVFLRIHGEVIVANPELREQLHTLRENQQRASEKLLELLASSLGTLGFVRDTL